MTIIFAYLMGTYPDDHFYTFVAVIIPVFYAIRLVEFYYCGFLFYFIDLCYFGTYMLWLFIVVYPKSEWLYNMNMILAFGTLACSVLAFMNPFDLANDCCAMIYHYVPCLVMYNINCVTIVN